MVTDNPATGYIEGETYKSIVYDDADDRSTSYGGVLWVESDVMAPGMQVVTDGSSDESCIMTSGENPNDESLKQCDDPFQTSKRVKVFSSDTDGPVDLVFDIATGSSGLPIDPFYRFFLKYENLSPDRIESFTLELGYGIGDDFTPSAQDDGLAFTDRDGIKLDDPAADLGDNSLAGLFAFGLFGNEEDNMNQINDGYYDPVNRGTFTMDVDDEDKITAFPVSANVADLYDGAVASWIPKEIAPYGYFYDMDANPDTDPLLIADYDEAGQGWQTYRLCEDAIIQDVLEAPECRADATVGPVALSEETIAEWENDDLFEVDQIEDFGNVNVNVHIKVDDGFVGTRPDSTFTIRITPTKDETNTGSPWGTPPEEPIVEPPEEEKDCKGLLGLILCFIHHILDFLFGWLP